MIDLAFDNARPVFTIGHSTRPLETFIGLLMAHGITALVDVRTIPRSRHNPQFNQDTFPDALAVAGIGYVYQKGLGGLRHARPDSQNTAWRNSSFRGFADYMQTREFAEALERIEDIARTETIALMCAEVVPWRCHRSLIADALLVRGHTVCEIQSETKASTHVLTPWAKVDGLTIIYPFIPDKADEVSERPGVGTAQKEKNKPRRPSHSARATK